MNALGIEKFLRKVENGKQLSVSYIKANQRERISGVVTGFTPTHVSILEEGMTVDETIPYHSFYWHSLECEPIPLKNIQNVEEFKENIKKLMERFEDGTNEDIGFTIGEEKRFRSDVETTILWINERLASGFYDGRSETLEALRNAKAMLLEMEKAEF